MTDQTGSGAPGNTIIPEKLSAYGFLPDGNGGWLFRKPLQGCDLVLTVRITPEERLDTEVIDPVFQEPYTLHLAKDASGAFVGAVRAQYEEILHGIMEQCFASDVFHAKQTLEVIRYAKNTYGDDPEFLWQKFPANAVLRRKDTGKWYCAILTVPRRKLGLETDPDRIAEILDMRLPPECPEDPQTSARSLIRMDGRTFFPAWHMNKKTWYTVLLDGSADTGTIYRLMDESYRLAVK